MFCYNCGCHLSEHDFCTSCGADVSLYKKVIRVSNMFYNEGLEKAGVRDLSGAIVSLRQSLKFNKDNIKARNLLGLVYYEMGEVVTALSQWVISKNMQPEKNIADEYIDRLQSNSGRLDSINQTIKKYNRALAQCNQGNKDLAVIQLKKVLSLNPRFIHARQLLALLYMDRGEWDRAERELRRCMEIDRNNLQTMRYLKEVEQTLIPEEGEKPVTKRKKEEAVRYQSENELIIQPLNVKEPGRSGVATVLNLAIGLVIGLAVMYFLVMPTAQSKARNEAQETITKISNESDGKTVRIQELEGQVASLKGDISSLNQQIDAFVGEDGTLQNMEGLLHAAASYLKEEDIVTVAADLETVSGKVDMEQMTEGFQDLYGAILAKIGPELAVQYYNTGNDAYRAGNYPEAIEALVKAVNYDAANVEALYLLAQSYNQNGNGAEAIAAYDKVIELFPGTQRARSSQQARDRLAAGN